MREIIAQLGVALMLGGVSIMVVMALLGIFLVIWNAFQEGPIPGFAALAIFMMVSGLLLSMANMEAS